MKKENVDWFHDKDLAAYGWKDALDFTAFIKHLDVQLAEFGVEIVQGVWKEYEGDFLYKVRKREGIKDTTADVLKLIKSYHDRWIEHLGENSSDIWMQEATIFHSDDIPILVPICKVDREDGFTEIVERYDDLRFFGTSCGSTSCSEVFSRPGIVEFLQAHAVEFLVGAVAEDYIDDLYHSREVEKGVPLGMIAFSGSEELAEAFANIVGHYGGSLRWDDSSDGQCVFESE
jgi:hypothetical protein